MRLRDWFKSKKAKAIAMLGCFAMLIGVGASVSVVSAVKENEVVETKAWTYGNIIYCALAGKNINGNSDWVTYDPMTINTSNDTAYGIYVINSGAAFTFTYKREQYGGNDWCNGKTVSTSLSGFGGGGSSDITYSGSSIRVKITVQSPYADSGTIIIENAPYTIRYEQNDGTSYYVTDTKNYGETYTFPALATLGLGASGGRYFLRWDTNSGGTGTRYAIGASYTGNADLTVYMIQDWYYYWYSLDSGSNWTQMTHDDEGKPSQYARQYRSDAITLSAGKTITFSRTEASTYTSASAVSASSWEHNANSSGVIQVTSSGKIYLKIKNDSTHDVYVEGGAGTRWVDVNGTKYEMTTTSENTDWYTTTLVTLNPGDKVKGGYTSGDPYNLSSASGDGSFTISGTVTCDAPGVFTIHLISTDGGVNFSQAQFVMDATGSAILFAQTFNSAIETVCNGILDKTKTLDNLKTAWGMSSSAGQNFYYNSLTSTAQTAVKTGSSDSNVVACRAKYDYVGGLYRDTLPDFMGRSSHFTARAIPAASSNNQSPLTLTLWIVLGAGVLGLGAIGTAYFVSKKKKKRQA